MYEKAESYDDAGKSDSALSTMEQALEIAVAISYEEKLGDVNERLAWYNISQGNYRRSMDHALTADSIYKAIDDSSGISKAQNVLAAIYYYQGQYPQALERFKRSARIDSSIGKKHDLASSYVNIGSVYDRMDSVKSSLSYLKKAERIYRKLGDTLALTDVRINMAGNYKKLGEWKRTLPLYKKALHLYEQKGKEKRSDLVLNNLARSYMQMGRTDSALFFLKKGLSYAREQGDAQMMKELYASLTDVHRARKEWKQALTYMDSSHQWKDTLRKERMEERLAEMEVKYETKKKEAQLAKKEKRLREQELRQKMLMGGLAFLLLVVLLVLWNYYVKRKANRRLEERNALIEEKNQALEDANRRITEQKEKVEEAHHEITQSIDYAQKIQNALLQSEEHVSPHLPEHFILFKPQAKVSGDFYWAREHKGFLYIAAVDCTGHGVPGAFMSMLGISQLNEIMNTDEIPGPGSVLTKLRDRVIQELRSSDPESAMKDGMDAAILKIRLGNSDSNSNEGVRIEFAGAQNPLYVVRSGIANEDPSPLLEDLAGPSDLTGLGIHDRLKPFKKSPDGIEIKGDPMPVGHDEHAEGAFTTISLQVQKGDMLYIFSDGYADQFGGPKGKKFRYGPFKKLLAELHEKPLEEQKQELDRTFEDWKAESQQEQIDDVVVIGLRV